MSHASLKGLPLELTGDGFEDLGFVPSDDTRICGLSIRDALRNERLPHEIQGMRNLKILCLDAEKN